MPYLSSIILPCGGRYTLNRTNQPSIDVSHGATLFRGCTFIKTVSEKYHTKRRGCRTGSLVGFFPRARVKPALRSKAFGFGVRQEEPNGRPFGTHPLPRPCHASSSNVGDLSAY